MYIFLICFLCFGFCFVLFALKCEGISNVVGVEKEDVNLFMKFYPDVWGYYCEIKYWKKWYSEELDILKRDLGMEK